MLHVTVVCNDLIDWLLNTSAVAYVTHRLIDC